MSKKTLQTQESRTRSYFKVQSFTNTSTNTQRHHATCQKGSSYLHSAPIDYRLQIRFETVATPDVNEIMLEAVEPPDHSNLSFFETMHLAKRDKARDSQLNELLARAQMHPIYLHFNHLHETGFCYYLHKNAVKRIRYAMAIGFVFFLTKCLYEAIYESTRDNDDMIKLFQFGFVLPIIFFTFCATLYERFTPYCEYYTPVAFITTTIGLTLQKYLEGAQGAILALFVLFIPVFGITRLRFSTSLSVSVLMFLIYMIGTACGKDGFSPSTFYQGFNYLAVILGGAVSHYRQEVLRRRNYMLYLPFEGGGYNPHLIYSEIKKPAVKKNRLLDRRTLQFRNPVVEEAFSRFWYLIDMCPFDHTNAGALHQRVFMALRFAVGGVVFGQVMLAVQDLAFLKRASVSDWIYDFASILRFGVVIPVYLSSGLFMYYFGKNYYRKWRAEACHASRGGVLHHPRSTCRGSAESSDSKQTNNRYFASSTPTENIEDMQVNRQCNYVPKMQCISALIVFVHGLAMGLILLALSNDLYKKGRKLENIATCYYLGLLNAILFPHRSGYRVRFIYATTSTLVLSIVFICVCLAFASHKIHEYGSYVLVTQALGMMISYEEETLRRAFFVRRCVRIVEYNKWYDAVARISPWLRRCIHARRARRGEELKATKTNKTGQSATNQQMANASKYGMYVEAGKALVSGIVEGFAG